MVLKTKGLDYYNQWISHEVPFQDPGIKDAFDNYVGKIFFTDGYVFGGNTAIVATAQTTTDGSDVHRRSREPRVLDAEDPDLVRPGLLPGSAGERTAVEVRHR